MRKKTFLVTNGSDGAISLVGRTRITIPGNCKNHPVSLSAEKAQAIVSRLKRTCPLLKIVEAPETEEAPTREAKAADSQEQQATPSAPEAKAVSAAAPEAKAAVSAPEAATGSAQNSAKKK